MRELLPLTVFLYSLCSQRLYQCYLLIATNASNIIFDCIIAMMEQTPACFIVKKLWPLGIIIMIKILGQNSNNLKKNMLEQKRRISKYLQLFVLCYLTINYYEPHVLQIFFVKFHQHNSFFQLNSRLYKIIYKFITRSQMYRKQHSQKRTYRTSNAKIKNLSKDKYFQSITKNVLSLKEELEGEKFYDYLWNSKYGKFMSQPAMHLGYGWQYGEQSKLKYAIYMNQQQKEDNLNCKIKLKKGFQKKLKKARKILEPEQLIVVEDLVGAYGANGEPNKPRQVDQPQQEDSSNEQQSSEKDAYQQKASQFSRKNYTMAQTIIETFRESAYKRRFDEILQILKSNYKFLLEIGSSRLKKISSELNQRLERLNKMRDRQIQVVYYFEQSRRLQMLILKDVAQITQQLGTIIVNYFPRYQ